MPWCQNGISKELWSLFHTISVCLSKGLGPVGSVLLGDKERYYKIKVKKSVLGGALRQAGYSCRRAGILCLENQQRKIGGGTILKAKGN